ncbi:DUF4403 family protein [Solitalea canadensis]|uniref:DUF4403 family protein n=1 Tax=Solitalea canadensis (strain ATCC 29591 / DSM 3403 / JCM 21819 / LMG 8368 / NBRC 15130 / NCIMB 12057 / USAM 9D) TaxID=929556 RepID=H8KSP7_SOLCM|nr:DUF4403 family protein [Solitalea canadensis]AFD05191.1 hypothetical protein Solca_0027 [Solitalea canadensis DSM 3403]
MNLKFNNSIFFLSLAIFFTSCATAIKPIKPVADYSNTKVIYTKELSTIQLPVEMSLKEIQTQINKQLTGLLYEDNSFENNNKDNVMLKVWKVGDIQFNGNGNQFNIILPIKIWANVGWEVEKYGVKLSDFREVQFAAKINLTSKLNVNNWKMSSTTVINSIDWLESPTVKIMGKDVPVTYLANPAISMFKDRIAKMVDAQVEKNVDFKPQIVDALKKLTTPMEVSKEYNTWINFEPQSFYATQPNVANKQLKIGLGLKTYIETAIGQKPEVKTTKFEPEMYNVPKINDDFNINVVSFVTYPNAVKLLQQSIGGKVFEFQNGKKKIKVEQIDLWGNNGKLITALTLSGSLNATVYLTGVPFYDPKTQQISLQQVSFELDTKNKLAKAADWLAHGTFTKMIENQAKFSIADQMKESMQKAQSYLNNYQISKGVFVKGKINDISPDKTYLTENAIVATVVAKGNMAIKIEGM